LRAVVSFHCAVATEISHCRNQKDEEKVAEGDVGRSTYVCSSCVF